MSVYPIKIAFCAVNQTVKACGNKGCQFFSEWNWKLMFARCEIKLYLIMVPYRLSLDGSGICLWCVRVCVCVCARARARACVREITLKLNET